MEHISRVRLIDTYIDFFYGVVVKVQGSGFEVQNHTSLVRLTDASNFRFCGKGFRV